MTRNITPRPIKAQGARDAHGRIFERGAGALYVHMHREAGLAHRHYVLRPWQVRVVGVLTSKFMIGLYAIAIGSWGWMASQAARVPLLVREVTTLTADAQRLDTLTATLGELQSRYDHVQRLLSVATAGGVQGAKPGSRPDSRASTAIPVAPLGPVAGSSKAAILDTMNSPGGAERKSAPKDTTDSASRTTGKSARIDTMRTPIGMR